jgi:hypothetical protein
VVFLGSVRNIEWDSRFPGAKFVVYRFKVEIVYKGLPPAASEILIDPGHTGCGGEFKNNTKYIIFAHKMDGSNQFVSDECSGSRPADLFPEDLRFLEASRLHPSPSFVFGKVLQYDSYNPYVPSGQVPLEGARVVLSKKQEHLVSSTNPRGEFRFSGLRPGSYTLSANRKPSFRTLLRLS